MNCQKTHLEPMVRPWMAWGMSILLLTSIGCCGNRANRLIQMRRLCDCNCHVARPATDSPLNGQSILQSDVPTCATTPDCAQSSDCAQTPDQAPTQNDSATDAEPAAIPNELQDGPTESGDNVAPPKPDSSSRREQPLEVTPKTGERTSAEGKNDQLHSVVDPELIRQLAITPVAPEPPATDAALQNQADEPANGDLAETQQLANPGVSRDKANEIAAVEVMKNQAESILNAFQSLNKPPEPSDANSSEPASSEPAVVFEQLPALPATAASDLPNLVVLRAIAPDSIMRKAGSELTGNQFNQVASPIGSGVPAVQASHQQNSQGDTPVRLSARPLAPGSFPAPQSKELIFRQPEPVILKAGSANTETVIQPDSNVPVQTNAASITVSGN